MARRAARAVTLLLAPAAGQQEIGHWAGPVCASGRVQKRRIHVAAPPAAPVYVMDLGQGSQLRLSCVGFRESPSASDGMCEPPSVPRVCKRNTSNANCRDLPEFTYATDNEVVLGGVADSEVPWILMWDPRGKPPACYPREVKLSIAWEFKERNKGSTAMAVVAIVIVVVLAIIIAAFCISQLVARVKHQQKEKHTARIARREHAQSMAVADGGACGAPRDSSPPPAGAEWSPSHPRAATAHRDDGVGYAAASCSPRGGDGWGQDADLRPTAAAAGRDERWASGAAAGADAYRPRRGGFPAQEIAGRALRASASPARDPDGDPYAPRGTPGYPATQPVGGAAAPLSGGSAQPFRPVSLSPPNPLSGAFPPPPPPLPPSPAAAGQRRPHRGWHPSGAHRSAGSPRYQSSDAGGPVFSEASDVRSSVAGRYD